MSYRKKSGSLNNWLYSVLSSPVMQLVASTLAFGALTLFFFWSTVKWNLLPIELSTNELSQENTGLFDALGGWTLGFAGALVAIRIAGLAANIQQNDSIREQVNVWSGHVERISDLNSRLTRAAYDAKRACAAVMLHAEELYITEELPSRLPSHLTNSIYTKDSKDLNSPDNTELEKQLQQKLENKLEVLIEVIEEAFKDSVYRAVLDHVEQGKTPISASLVSDYFDDAEKRKLVVDIIKKDNQFFNIVEGLNHGTRNFGVGLMELRAKRLFEHFKKDLMRITEFQKKESSTTIHTIEISDAAWLFLGLLLLRSKGSNGNQSQNHGFIFIALLLGSLPTDKTVESYLNAKKKEVQKTYSKAAKFDLSREISELSRRMYFVKGRELKELAILVMACNEQLEYLEVHAKNTGISTTSYGDDSIKQIATDDGSDDKSGKDSSDSKSKG